MDSSVRKPSGPSPISDVWESDAALSLLRAAPFRLTAGSDLHFAPIAQAANVLCSDFNHVPKSDAEWVSRLSPLDARERRKAINRLTWDGATYKLIYQWQNFQGEPIWIEEQGRRQFGQGDRPTKIDGVIRNITVQKRADDRAAFLANHDDLTGVFNLDFVTRSLEHLAALCHRQHSQGQQSDGALLRLRINNLGDINDIYGYDTGDAVLAEIAKSLSYILRPPDISGRIGGADFALILYGASQEEVKAITDRLFVLLKKSPVKTPHGRLFGEVSIGSTQMRTNAKSAQEALTQSLTALKQAKPFTLCQYNKTMASASVETPRETSERDILDALNQRRIQLAYQPIIDAKTSTLHHYECLLRLKREDGEVVSAGRFIMAAERLGLVNLLDRRALELASETLAADPSVHLALNVSAATVKEDAVAAEYIQALKALGPRAKQVTIELTETVALDDPAKASEFSNHVRSLGCEFAIDDFGSGYTTFRNLMAIEADTIKIDGTLIQGIASDVSKQTFVRMMVDLAQTFGVETVAEMVDDRADAQILRRLGIDYFQGFMFGVPSAAPSWQKQAS